MPIDRRTLVIGSAAVTTAASIGLGTGAAGAAPGDVPAGGDAARNPPNPKAATSSKTFPNLFSPIEIGGVRLKNRVVHAAMTSYPSGSEQYLDYNANRARGGAAMIVTEDTGAIFNVDPAGPTGPNAQFLRRMVDAVERHDCRLVIQISNSGRGRHDPGRLLTAIGPSALPCDISWTVPHVLTTAEVKQFIANWGKRARYLKDAGVSGVEISASHGHLVHQFLSAESNQRTDEYGGDIKNRTRFLTEIIAAIRQNCGRPFIIGVKLVGQDGIGIDLAQSKAMTQLIHDTGELDYLTFGWGTFANTLYWHAPAHYGPRMPYLEREQELAKAAPGVPLGAIGLITDPVEGEHIVGNKLADLVMMARPLTADAAWAVKASEGRQDEIRKCVSCNTCWQFTTMMNSPVRCDNNPRVAAPDEADWRPAKAATSKRVVVVGGGVAGMEAAWIAAARGHDVTVFSASAKTGGKTRLQAQLPGGAGLPYVFDYQSHAAGRYGVKLNLNKRATLDDILALHPDAVILATGSTMSRPAFLPADQEGQEKFHDLRAVTAMMLARPAARQKGTAVIFDYDHTAMTYAAAEYFKDIFDHVVLVTPRDSIAVDEAVITRQGIYHRFSSKKIEVLVSSTPLASSSFAEGKVICGNAFDGSQKVIDHVALFTYATPRTPNDELAAPLRSAGIEPHLIGDCWAPRLLLTATSDGHNIGTSI